MAFERRRDAARYFRRSKVTVRSTTVARKGRVDRSAAPARPWGGVVDHLVLLKPRVMSLVVFTGAVGFALAPAPIDWMKLLATLSAMAAGAGACGALNMWWDADIDANMARTAMRPDSARRRASARGAGDRHSALGRVGGRACDQGQCAWRRRCWR